MKFINFFFENQTPVILFGLYKNPDMEMQLKNLTPLIFSLCTKRLKGYFSPIKELQ